jgi:hypothetical protein
MLNLSPELDALTRRLDAEGCTYSVKETYAGRGLTLMIRFPDAAGIPSPGALRTACAKAVHDRCTVRGRILLREVAARLGVSSQATTRALMAARLHVRLISGHNWIERDAAWERFVNGATARTPV